MQSLTDNTPWTDIQEFGLTNEDVTNLEKIANIPIDELRLEQNPSLLVFPRDLGVYGDEISESEILHIKEGKIRTGNIMGFVGCNGTELNIKSRFAKSDPDDYFLHYLLQRVFAINLFDLKHTSAKESVFDFLLYLFPHFLKQAVRQGIFRKYERREYNDSRVRGVVDTSRHIHLNIPFNGNIAYNCREHTYDNEVTELVRHTIEFIKTKQQGRFILENDVDTKAAVNAIIMATPGYAARERGFVISQNLRPIRHPYFDAYPKLQKLCIQILRHESIKYGQSKNEVYGVLFDGAWLWEEYLNKILCKLDFKHPRNKKHRGGIRMFKNEATELEFDSNKRKLYPDFYKDNFILDAKYKHLNSNICREDLYQVVTYMYCTHSQYGGYVHPLEKPSNTIWYQLSGYENGNEGRMAIIPFYVPQAAGDWKQYGEEISKSEDTLVKTIQNPK